MEAPLAAAILERVSISPFQDCPGEEALARARAAEYAQPPRAVPGEYWVLMDQVERQSPGPGPNHDALYGEPIVPERPENDDPLTPQTWNFRGPYTLNFVISSFTEERNPVPGGSTFMRTIQASVPAISVNDIPCVPTIDQVDNAGPLFTTPKPGDVVWVGGRASAFYDVDEVQPDGFLTAASLPVAYNLTLVRRSKFVPERKNVLPTKEDFAVVDDEGTGQEP